MDLFRPVVEPMRWHPNFRNIMEERYHQVRNVLQEWAEGFIDRDGKFVKEFQSTFNSAFWELYLYAAIRDLGFSVDFAKSRPDFVVTEPEQFCIEATVASNPNGGTPEWDKKTASLHEDWTKEKIVDLATIRLANAFVSKARKYNEEYSSLEYVKNKPFVIAIAPFEQPFSFDQRMHAIRRVLYGYDRVLAIDWDAETRQVFGHEYMEEIQKENGAEIPLGYFLDPKYRNISAVIFSTTATFGKARVMSEDPRFITVDAWLYNDFGLQETHIRREKPDYKETLIDGLYVFHNPLAVHPFTFNQVVEHPQIANLSYDIDANDLISHMPHGFLLQRIVHVANLPGGLKDVEKHRRAIRKTYRNVEKPKYPRFHP